MNTTPARPAEKLPDPWLFDSEALLRELARCRETALQIPITNPNATHFGIQLTVNAIYDLEVNLRHLLHLHRDKQRSIRRQHVSRRLIKVFTGSVSALSSTTVAARPST